MKYLFFLIILSIVSCATMTKIDPNNMQAVIENINITHDNYRKFTKYTGPNCAPNGGDYLILRATKTDGGENIYQIYVHDIYSYKWRFYNDAHDSEGNNLDFHVLKREVEHCGGSYCSYSEYCVINVSKEYLESKKENGIDFKISGQRGQEIFFIPGPYVSAFLNVAQ